ncbi:hypothetical protein, partial [Staphylococcus aureus]
RLLFEKIFFLMIRFLMIRRPPRSTRVRSSAASDVYKRQICSSKYCLLYFMLSLIHISEPTRHAQISYAVFCLKKFCLSCHSFFT